jgi:hypothetical protein
MNFGVAGEAAPNADEGDEVELPLDNARGRKVLIESVEKGQLPVAAPLGATIAPESAAHVA